MISSQKYYVGLDVSLEETAVCIVNYEGEIVKEAMVLTDPESIDTYLRATGLPFEKIGLEASNITIWLYWKLTELGHHIIPIETRRAAAFMSAQKVKTDRNDARGISQMIRGNFYTEVHVKSDESQRFKLILNNRRFLVQQRVDIENQVRGSLKTFGMKTGTVTELQYEQRIRELIEDDGELDMSVSPLLKQRQSGIEQIALLDKILRSSAKDDIVCQILMTAPGVGLLTALLYKAVIDDPTRFKHSRDVPTHLGLTPKKYASGQVDYNGGITKAGDAMLRNHLYIASTNLMRKSSKPCALKTWGRNLHQRSSYKKACVAVSRKLSIIMHRMWVDGKEFNWGDQKIDCNFADNETVKLTAI